MLIISAPCWKCDKDMKIALLGTESGDLIGGPEIFSEKEKQLAVKNGVTLKIINSKTAEETYLANTCPHCDAFVGKWFYFAHYLTPALYGDLEYTDVA
jgi:hypothetical protein